LVTSSFYPVVGASVIT